MIANERSANGIDRRLGQRVRARRLEIGMSQERLAELAGVTFQQVQKYEKGVNRMAASRLFVIACSLDMPIEHFFAGMGPRRSAHGVSEINEIAGFFARIKSKDSRRSIVAIAKAVAEARSPLSREKASQ